MLFYDIGKSKYKERCAISETGTGFACAKLSGGQKPSPPVASAPVVGMTQKNSVPRFVVTTGLAAKKSQPSFHAQFANWETCKKCTPCWRGFRQIERKYSY